MSIHAALTHRTSYRYARAVTLGPQTIRLRPAPHARTPILSYSLKIEPAGHFLNWQQDPQGNYLARVIFPERVTHFDVTVDLVADMATINPFEFFVEESASAYPFAYEPALAQELAPFMAKPIPGPLLAALLAEMPTQADGTVDMLVDINRTLASRIAYVVRMEPGVWTPEETLTEQKGSCRDSAWLLVQILRQMGFAARFVSGYLIQLVADVKPVTGPEGPTTDFTDLHAWAEVYLPGAGWIGFDATSGLMAGEGHIPLACSPEPQSAAAISGGVEANVETTFEFAMNVTRIAETPRVTKPYTDKVWQDILRRGEAVDRALERGQVRLTMGGEPTFVAATDFDAAEWNIEAMGPTKRTYAGKLMRRLAPLWAPGAALQYSMGKHYPGEQLPRWAIHAHWRRDGQPVWRDPALFAADEDTDDATAEDALDFARTLAERLQLDPEFVSTAHEDIHYYLWREKRLPANVIAEAAKLADPLERARLARVFGGGLGAGVGAVLPLRRVLAGGVRRWQSGHWFFRDDVLFLVPGDSPIGLRLPLESLPWIDPAAMETDYERDPFAPREAFPARSAYDRVSEANGAQGLPIDLRPQPQAAPSVANPQDPARVRTALTVESRDGKLHIFLPPLYAAEDFLDLAAAIEDTAREAGRQIVIEGYQPPRDPRLNSFSITPDPGVIEVNIHPSASWNEHVTRTETLYEEARQAGLSAEKFMIDGRHVGTGGGNHLVMGAAEPADSPFLRRPDLLKSLLGFWHNHPSLSYLFSGLFIGPSSQHPRIDEARQDMLAELEAAFAQIEPGKETPPWVVDRLFRNILADMTGNTHRTEFCIDKMYAPETATGRLGLVEYRAFEMPPHARMSAAQALLLRSAIAAFWNQPYERKLIRWGTRIHDDFMLPHFVEQDLYGALDELGTLGFPMAREWFAPHLEFRFPLIGNVAVQGMELELRHALEPWHVLGEEPAGGATARYVDSSAERLQARITGFSEERYILAANGHAVPLSRTDREGEYVAGIRFKAWAPYSALHPLVPVQTPVVLDIHDRWSGRRIGGLTHHVFHPGGRAHEDRPVNANAAEARRRIRFAAQGHTPGPAPEPVLDIARDTPRTLDLRRLWHG
ncbi:transglutaminase family protein [Plastoroseomonas arctica]|uniref:Transglutaminase family protein n=1 Tax=Plastoroseomonas arctica TaxID=1509237 RepID=A0AAF1K4M0_9PROT|nr:transglutaminase family protein [Plastoroseomonas arctica]MBR0656166.1 transglutaminase family protein [Plastoroseomonas arctica]